jgi:hypothetical protein
MKELFSFNVSLTQEVDKTETKEENGKTITVSSKETQEIPYKIIIKNPSRRNIEDAELQFSIEMSNCIKKGILTKGMLLKKYSDSGGFILEADRVELGRLYSFIITEQENYQQLTLKTNRDKDEEARVITSIIEAKKRMSELESAYNNLFNNTADSIAQNNVIRWFCLNMAHKQKLPDGKIEPMFSGETIEEKIEALHKMDDEDDPLYTKAYKKLATFAAFWYFSKNAKREDFEKLNSDIEQGTVDS